MLLKSLARDTREDFLLNLYYKKCSRASRASDFLKIACRISEQDKIVEI